MGLIGSKTQQVGDGFHTGGMLLRMRPIEATMEDVGTLLLCSQPTDAERDGGGLPRRTGGTKANSPFVSFTTCPEITQLPLFTIAHIDVFLFKINGSG